MSAPQPNTVLPFSSSARSAFQKVLQQLAALEPQVISDLASQTEETILELWTGAKQLERHAWVVRCFCAAATWGQVTSAKRGRGNKDIAQKGILAAVSRRSKKLGVTPSYVYRMSQIFHLLLDVQQNVQVDLNILDVLDEQGYWDHALNAADPTKAILEFAAKKTSLKRFRVTDAERLVSLPELSRKSVALKAVSAVREESGQLSTREALILHIRNSQEVIRNLVVPGCPDPEFSERVWEELLVELEEEYQELFDEDAYTALRKAWDQGHKREDALVKVTGFPQVDVARLMNVLAGMGEFIRVQERDVNKRSSSQLWHRVGRPFDNAKLMPMAKRG